MLDEEFLLVDKNFALKRDSNSKLSPLMACPKSLQTYTSSLPSFSTHLITNYQPFLFSSSSIIWCKKR